MSQNKNGTVVKSACNESKEPLNPCTADDAAVRFKAGLLCLGLRVPDPIGKKIATQRPYFFDKGFVHAINCNINGSNVCVSVAEKFCKRSPYVLTGDGDSLFITDGNQVVPIKLFKDLPKTDTVIDSLARPHSDECISLWPSTACCFDTPGRKCKFCSIEAAPVAKPQDVIAGLCALYKKVPHYSLNIGGGTVESPSVMVQYLIEIIKGFRQFSDKPVSVELAPPQDLSLIQQLYDAGASSLIINLEIANQTLRREICPGKSEITYDHYYATYRRAVSVFGRGKVSCVLLVGIQPVEDIIEECKRLIDVGVIPTLIPFKPMDNCLFNDRPPADPMQLMYASGSLGSLLRGAGLAPSCQEGCTKCGGCSLETDYERLPDCRK